MGYFSVLSIGKDGMMQIFHGSGQLAGLQGSFMSVAVAWLVIVALMIATMNGLGCSKSSEAADGDQTQEKPDSSSSGSAAFAEKGSAQPSAATPMVGGQGSNQVTGALMSFESPIHSSSNRANSSLEALPSGGEPELSSPPQLGVAVIDLNRVAIGLERLETYDDQLSEKRAELDQQLAALAEGFQIEVEDLKRGLGGGEDLASHPEVKAKEQQRAANLLDAKRQAAQQLAQYEEAIKRDFINEVRPVAFVVAREMGYGIVLAVPQVFAYQVGSDQDITNEVIDRMSVQTPSRPETSLPKLNSPPEETEK